jgi:hypothetical protein
MSNKDGGVVDDVFRKKISRRRAISTGGKIGAAVVATAVVAGAGGYLAGSSSASSSATKTVTNTSTTTVGGGSTVTQTVTNTVTGGNSSTGSTGTSTSTSSTGASYTSVPSDTAIWPLSMKYVPTLTNQSGTLNVFQTVSITYQTDWTVPGTRANTVLNAFKEAYPNVNTVPYNPGPNSQGLLTILQAGVNPPPYDIFLEGTPYPYMSLGYLEPITDQFNAWDGASQYSADTIANNSYNGDIYLVSDDTDPKSGWWRKDIFAAAGYGTFDNNTFEYTGTTPNQMNYTELAQAATKISNMSGPNGLYSTWFPNNSTAIIGSTTMMNYMRANGASMWHGNSSSCTVDLANAPNYNAGLDTLNFIQTIIPTMNPGFQSFDINALITDIADGNMAWFFGVDPNLDGQMLAQPLNKTNPSAPSSLNVRNGIQPSLPISDGNISTNLPPCPHFDVTWGAIKGTKNVALDFEYIAAFESFNSGVSLFANAAGIPSRLDAQAVMVADPYLDISAWIQALPTNMQYVDQPYVSNFGGLIMTAYTNSFDPFIAGQGTAEEAISNFVTATEAALEKAGIPSATTTSTSSS